MMCCMKSALDALPDSMRLNLKQLPKHDVAMSLFTRHSIRHNAVDGQVAGYDLALTTLGKQLAQDWGQYLVEQTQKSFATPISSPIQRCLDTASLMQLGAQQYQTDTQDTLPIEAKPLLVEPGSFVVDLPQAVPYFRQLGAIGFIDHFVQGKLPGMKIPNQGVYDILHMLYAHQPERTDQLGLAVSHDTILAAVLAVIRQQYRVSTTDWPEMMEGLFVWFEGDDFNHSTMYWLWRGELGQLDIQSLNIPV